MYALDGVSVTLRLECIGAISAHCSIRSLAQAILSPPESLGLQRWGFTMLLRLVLNSWSEAIHPPQPPKTPGFALLPGLGYSAALIAHVTLNFWAQAILQPQPPQNPHPASLSLETVVPGLGPLGASSSLGQRLMRRSAGVRSYSATQAGGQQCERASLQPPTPGSSNPPASVPQAETTGIHHHAWLIFVFSVETGFCHVAQAVLELLSSSNPPASASPSAGITGISNRTQPKPGILK
ncbi:hypothetical protein AAY473_015991, partial [Plecturocebus cupreus]